VSVLATAGGENLTDLGNARRLVRAFGDRLRYCPARRLWLVWNKKRWKPDGTLRVMRLAKATVREMYAEAARITADTARLALTGHARNSESEARLRAMVTLARSEPGIPVTPDDLDRDPWLFNVRNGTLNLRTGNLRPHRREDLITKIAPVAFDPTATCPRWDKFLSQIFACDEKLIAFLKKAVGYSLTGTARERVILFLYGIGANGKTTLIETLRGVFGDYGMTTAVETLLVKRWGGIPNDLARLKGARFVSTSEADQAARLAEALVKTLTGRDCISARFLYGEFFDFRPTFVLWVATNHRPIIRGTDEGIWDRIRLVPFSVRVPNAKQDKKLLEKLCAERAGILRWAVEGCLAWQREGLGVPPAVEQATALYRTKSDVLGPFLTECCVIERTARVKFNDLYAAYLAWTGEDEEGLPLPRGTFAHHLTKLGYLPEKGAQGARIRCGIRLRTTK